MVIYHETQSNKTKIDRNTVRFVVGTKNTSHTGNNYFPYHCIEFQFHIHYPSHFNQF